MGLTRWEPFNELLSLRDAMERFFDESFIRPRSLLRGEGEWRFPVDLYQTDKEVVVEALLPGINPDDVEITVKGDILTIKGEAKSERERKEPDYLYRERRYGAFLRTVTLPAEVDSDKAEAKFENGVLTLILPKAERVQGKRITITKK